MPSIDTPASAYKNVLTPAPDASLRNYQTFAYCPYLKQKHCGISDLESSDVTLHATKTPQTVSTNTMFFKKTRTSAEDFRKYDFCHYLIQRKPGDKIHDFSLELSDSALNLEIKKLYDDS